MLSGILRGTAGVHVFNVAFIRTIPETLFEPIYSATIRDFFLDSASSREGYRKERT